MFTLKRLCRPKVFFRVAGVLLVFDLQVVVVCKGPVQGLAPPELRAEKILKGHHFQFVIK
jgi:hypothetical protein